MKAIERTRKNSVNKNERRYCPVCYSIGTLGDVTTNAIDNRNKLEKVSFCSNCLSEFDDRGLRVFNSNGQYLYIDSSYRYLREE